MRRDINTVLSVVHKTHCDSSCPFDHSCWKVSLLPVLDSTCQRIVEHTSRRFMLDIDNFTNVSAMTPRG
jgi:hypothetical protein